MAMILEALRALRPWQIGVLVAVLAGAIGGTYGVYALATGSGQISLDEDQQLIPVRSGDLVNQVSISGSLVFAERASLTFGSQGTVAEVMVSEGQAVEEGQPLARLDATTMATLEAAVAQGRIDLRSAQDALAKALDPHTPLEMAQAEAGVASAKLDLKTVQEAVALLQEPERLDIAEAAAKVAGARLSLQEAQDALARLLEPTAGDIAQAGAKVADAGIAVDNASTTLAALRDGPTDEEIAGAQSQVNFAETILANAQGDLKLARTEWDEKMSVALTAFDTASVDYQGVFNRWLGVETSDGETDQDPDTLLASWGVDLSAIFDPGNADPFFKNVGPDDPDTPWSEMVLYAWLNFFPGGIVATCEDVSVGSQTLCVKKEMDDAWDARQAAADSLDAAETQAAKAIANAEDAVTKAEDGLATAVEGLADVKAGADALEIEDAESQLAVSLATLEETEDELSTLQDAPAALDLEDRQGQVALTQANLDQLLEDLAALTNEADPLELEDGRASVDVAQARLVEAEDELADLQGSVDPLEVALREAEVAAAQASLEAAVERLDSAALEAPWKGIVSRIDVEAGQLINANATVLELVDPTVVEVDGIVDEIDVLFILEGARATITMDALEGQTLEGSVSELGSAAQNQQGVVSYPVRILVQVPEGVQLREGLSATASVVLREDTDVLLIPLQAIYGTFEEPVVRLMSNGRIEERAVALGNSDDFWVVVLQGLREGDRVAMESAETSTDPFAQFRQRIQGGGGGGNFSAPGFGGGRR